MSNNNKTGAIRIKAGQKGYNVPDPSGHLAPPVKKRGKMKKVLIGLMMVGFLASNAYAQDTVNLSFASKKKVVFEPSSDERATGHVVYFDDGEKEWKKKIEGMEVSEWVIPDGILHPGKTYVFTMTAYDQYNNESERSNSVSVYIEPLPEIIDDLPKPYEAISVPFDVKINAI